MLLVRQLKKAVLDRCQSTNISYPGSQFFENVSTIFKLLQFENFRS